MNPHILKTIVKFKTMMNFCRVGEYSVRTLLIFGYDQFGNLHHLKNVESRKKTESWGARA